MIRTLSIVFLCVYTNKLQTKILTLDCHFVMDYVSVCKKSLEEKRKIILVHE